jgi:hypothetical protein
MVMAIYDGLPFWYRTPDLCPAEFINLALRKEAPIVPLISN